MLIGIENDCIDITQITMNYAVQSVGGFTGIRLALPNHD